MPGENLLKSTLRSGGTAFGTWTVTSSPMVANVLAESGMDFVTIDMEHGPTTFETAESMIYAIEAGGASAMIRLGEGSPPTILHTLDIGAQSFLVAHCTSGEQATSIVKAAKYHPEGDRGMAPFTRRHHYSDADLLPKLQHANDNMLVGVLIEDPEGLDRVEEIAATPGLDLVYIGMYDLSQAVGRPGDVSSPEVVAAARRSVEVVESMGLTAGSVARDRDHCAFLLDVGFRYISYLVDTAILRNGFADARGWFDELRAAGS